MPPRKAIILLSRGKGTWREALRIARSVEEPIILTAAYAAERIEKDDQIPGVKLSYNPDQSPRDLRDTFQKLLEEHVQGEGEVGVSLISGSGAEHAALLAALMRIPVGFRLLTLADDEIIDLTG